MALGPLTFHTVSAADVDACALSSRSLVAPVSGHRPLIAGRLRERQQACSRGRGGRRSAGVRGWLRGAAHGDASAARRRRHRALPRRSATRSARFSIAGPGTASASRASTSSRSVARARADHEAPHGRRERPPRRPRRRPRQRARVPGLDRSDDGHRTTERGGIDGPYFQLLFALWHEIEDRALELPAGSATGCRTASTTSRSSRPCATSSSRGPIPGSSTSPSTARTCRTRRTSWSSRRSTSWRRRRRRSQRRRDRARARGGVARAGTHAGGEHGHHLAARGAPIATSPAACSRSRSDRGIVSQAELGNSTPARSSRASRQRRRGPAARRGARAPPSCRGGREQGARRRPGGLRTRDGGRPRHGVLRTRAAVATSLGTARDVQQFAVRRPDDSWSAPTRRSRRAGSAEAGRAVPPARGGREGVGGGWGGGGKRAEE